MRQACHALVRSSSVASAGSSVCTSGSALIRCTLFCVLLPVVASCEQGYSQPLGSAVCRATDSCDDGKWFWPLAGVGVAAFATYLLMAGGVWHKLPHRTTVADAPVNIVKFTSFYFQMSALVQVSRYVTRVGWCAALVVDRGRQGSAGDATT